MTLPRRRFIQGSALLAALATAPHAAAAQAGTASTDPLATLHPPTLPPPRIEPSDYLRRLEKARLLMARQRVDALVLAGSNNMVYLCGAHFGAGDRLCALVVPRRGDPFLVCPAFEVARVRERMLLSTIELRAWEEDQDPFALTAQGIRQRASSHPRVALDGRLPYGYADRMAQTLPGATWLNADRITGPLRLIKEEKEIELTRQAARLTQMAYAAAFATIQPGIGASALKATFSQAMNRLGASGGVMLSVGAAAGLPHGSRQEYPIQTGSVLLVDGGCSLAGYPSDISRTLCVGNASAEVIRVFDIVRRAQQAAFQAMKPGVPCAAVDRAARRVVEEAGFGPAFKYFTHRLGHGLGLDGHDGHCHLVGGNETPLAPGMLFTVEPGIYLPGRFGIRCEDDVVVTENGIEILGTTPASAIDSPFG